MKQDEKEKIEELKTQIDQMKRNNLDKIDEINREWQAKLDELYRGSELNVNILNKQMET